MHLCVIIPALDEEGTVGRVIAGVRAVRMPADVTRLSVLVVDDGSGDATAAAAAAAGAEVVQHDRNYGVGRAFRTGIEHALHAGADLVLNIDADGQFDPADIPQLLEPLLAGRADFASASRFKDPALEPRMPWVKRWGNRQMSRVVSTIVGRRFHDVSCGFRAYTRDTALRLNLWGDFTYTQETFLDLSAKGMRLVEVPVRVRGEREVGDSRVAGDLWRYARKSGAILLRAFRDYWPLRFFGVLAFAFALPGAALLLFLAVHFLRVRHFFPHIWAGFVGGALLMVAVICLITGLLAEILKRIRLNEEEVLYQLRRREFDTGAGSVAPASPAVHDAPGR